MSDLPGLRIRGGGRLQPSPSLPGLRRALRPDWRVLSLRHRIKMKNSLEITVKKDGAAWCANRINFINLQESDAGFGESPLEAVGALLIIENEKEIERCKKMRRWLCTNCQSTFSRGNVLPGDVPWCPTCKCFGQYVYEAKS